MVERGIAPLQLLTAPGGPAFMSAVASGALTLIGSETAAVILDDELYDDPVRPFPRDWHEALERLGDETGPASATTRSWPHPHSPLRDVLRQALIVDGVARGQLILVGRPDHLLQGRARLLAGFAAALADFLLHASDGRGLWEAPPQSAFSALQAGLLITAPPAGPAPFRTATAEPVGAWTLSLTGRLLNASTVALLVADGDHTETYSEWPAAAAPAPAAVRRALAEAAASREAPLTRAALPPGISLRDADATDVVGVPFSHAGGQSGALLLLRHEPPPFDVADLEAATVLLQRGQGEATSADRTFDLESLRAAESRRLAGELHDGRMQQLTAAAMEAEVALKLMQHEPQRAALSVQRSRDEVRRVIGQLRSLTFDLRLANVSELGLVGALKAYAQEFARRAGVALELHLPAGQERLPEPAAQALFLIAREALSNVQKHARAATVRLGLECSADQITLRIQDDGVGFATGAALAAAARDRHFGLLGMQERVERLRGSVSIVSRPGAGALVEATIPRTEGAP